jgi:hypothetical protein
MHPAAVGVIQQIRCFLYVSRSGRQIMFRSKLRHGRLTRWDLSHAVFSLLCPSDFHFQASSVHIKSFLQLWFCTKKKQRLFCP